LTVFCYVSLQRLTTAFLEHILGLYRFWYNELSDFMQRVLQDIDNWAFDVFQINEIGDGHALKYIGVELLQKYDLINKYKVRPKTTHCTQPGHPSVKT